MKENWNWIIRYAAVIAVALILAAALGEMELFRTTRIGHSGLNAARIVQFLGYGGALLVFWLIVQRGSDLIDGHDSRWSVLKSLLVPLASLIVVAAGQAVLLRILDPLMSSGWHEAYNWFFIAAILLCAFWLAASLFTGSPSLAFLRGTGDPTQRDADQ